MYGHYEVECKMGKIVSDKADGFRTEVPLITETSILDLFFPSSLYILLI